MSTFKNTHKIAALTAAGALFLTGCVSGESATQSSAAAGAQTETLTIDFATYNPLSLVIKEQGWLEAELEDVEVTWVQSAGSNKANEGLRSETLDIGSTAGSAALLNRANGAPIKTISLYSQPEWAALVVGPDSEISQVSDLAGKTVAATKGTDPYFFLIQALAQAGVDPADVEVQNLQHADGGAALKNGSVDAWSGLDPITAGIETEWDAQLFYRNLDFNTWGFLNAREDFLEEQPELAQAVVDAYERARGWAAENPEELTEILADYSGIDVEVAQIVLERTGLDIDPVPGDVQRAVLDIVGPIFIETGDVDGQETIDDALNELFDDSFARNADGTRFEG